MLYRPTCKVVAHPRRIRPLVGDLAATLDTTTRVDGSRHHIRGTHLCIQQRSFSLWTAQLCEIRDNIIRIGNLPTLSVRVLRAKSQTDDRSLELARVNDSGSRMASWMRASNFSVCRVFIWASSTTSATSKSSFVRNGRHGRSKSSDDSGATPEGSGRNESVPQ